MSGTALPPHHLDPRLEVFHPYLSATVEALQAVGVRVAGSWLDPMAPRDATIRLADGRALVWDEETGWRVGGYVRGEAGVRTELADVRHLGGGVLPTPWEVVERLLVGMGEPLVRYRSYDDEPERVDRQARRYRVNPGLSEGFTGVSWAGKPTLILSYHAG
ncbi:hypothetical protein GCM10009678_10030 [Actinomadura kijaniata]|uniref:DUF6292 domain-containing protein n=1 Tax=Actinomadura namibiensis TaxID=182080 RepID=A0A7W3QJT2_ACTNM|nr:DUF6292 family protein [Actinomadura namibiensis]MBA8949258.1 hypothetical protein [Actinomadura namibiensis]